MLKAWCYTLVIHVAYISCAPYPMDDGYSTSKEEVERVNNFVDLFPTSPKQRQVRDGNVHQYASVPDLDNLSMYDVEYIKKLVDSGGGDELDDLWKDAYGDYPDSHFDYQDEGVTNASEGPWQGEAGQSSTVMSDAIAYPVQVSEDENVEKQGSLESDIDASLDQKNSDDEESCLEIYLQHSPCDERTARSRFSKKLNTKLRRMLLSKDPDLIQEASHILSCRTPNDVFNTDETGLLIDKIEQRVKMNRKLASSVIRLGQIDFPKLKKKDLYGNNKEKFDDAFQILYQGYMKRNAERAKVSRKLKLARRRKKGISIEDA